MSELRRRLIDLIEDPTAFLADPDPALRRLAASVDGSGGPELERLLRDDPEPAVRAAAAEAMVRSADAAALLACSGDPSAEVREAIAFALGEVGDRDAVPWLMETAAADGDDAVREAAVAALGSIEDQTSLPLLIELSAGAPPKVRRRAVVALSAFDDPDAEAAIRAAAADRNPMVKEVAEMVVGPQPEDLPFPTTRPKAE